MSANFVGDMFIDQSDPGTWKPEHEQGRRRRKSSSSGDEGKYKDRNNFKPRPNYGVAKRFYYDNKRIDRRYEKDKFRPRGKRSRSRSRSRGHSKNNEFVNRWDDRGRDRTDERSHSNSKYGARLSPQDRRGPRSGRRRSSSSSSSSSRSRSRSSSAKRSRRTKRRYSSRSHSSSPELISARKQSPPKVEVIDLEEEMTNIPTWPSGQTFQQYPTQPGSGRQFPTSQPAAPSPQHFSTNSTFPPGNPPRGFPTQPVPPQFSQASSQPGIEGDYSGYQGQQGFPPAPHGFQSYPSYEAAPNSGQQPFFQQMPPTFTQPPSVENYGSSYDFLEYNVDQEWKDPSKSSNPSNLIYPSGQTSSVNRSQQSQGVEEELLQQKRTLLIQREEYLKKNNSLQRELARLKDQRKELLQDPSKDNERILRENTKLQNEITQRLKAIENVIEMLTGLIGDTLEAEKKEVNPMSPAPPAEKIIERAQENERAMIYKWNDEEKRSPPSSEAAKSQPLPSPPLHLPQERPPILPHSNIIYYDPGLHWCPLCNVFPKTAHEYLNHLHTPQHRANIVNFKLNESPWHSDIPKEIYPPFIKDAPSKRVPIRGVQFLVPSTGWYCRLCKTWLGDIHCSSEHLKGQKHTTNYSDYISQNPHWEVDWLTDRTKSYERSSVKMNNMVEAAKEQPKVIDDNLESEKAKINVLSSTLLAVLAQQNKVKSRNKRSSSSSSDSSSDQSLKKSKKSKKKKNKKKKKKDDSLDGHSSTSPKNEKKPEPPPNDDLISEWMESGNKNDEITVEDLKGRVKQKNIFAKKEIRQRIIEDDKLKEEKLKENKDIRKKDMRNSKEIDRRDNIRRDRRESPKDMRRRDERDHPDRRRDQFDERRRDQFDDRRRDPGDDRRRDLGEDRRRDQVDDRRKDQFEDRRRDQLDDRRKDKRDSSPNLLDKKELKKLEKPQGKLWFPSSKSEEEETMFEKQAAESAAKKKAAETRKPTQFTLPKAKLPFIGRMPILKKKPTDQKSDESGKDVEKEDDKDNKGFIWPDIPSVPEAPEEGEADEKPLPKSTLIISKRPRLPEPDDMPKSVLLTADMKKKTKLTEDNLAEQDMDIECDVPESVIWEANEDNTDSKEELHKDFKDALDLLFPEEGKKVLKEDSNELVPPESIDYNSQNWLANSAAYGYPSQAAFAGTAAATYYGPGFEGGFSAGYYPTQRFPTPTGYAVPPGPPPGLPPGHVQGSLPATNIPPPVVPTNPQPANAPIDMFEEEPSVKKKNPPSQRMRRHLQKKRAEGKAEPAPPEEPKKKYEGMDVSDLAMLGIDEGDSIAQQI